MAIKKLQHGFTNPEQSKRLLELGVPADSADMYYKHTMLSPYLFSNGVPFSVYSKVEDIIPCWSVGRLFEICKLCEPKKDYEQLCDEMKYCNDVMELTISHIKDNIPIMDFSKLAG